MAAAAAAAAVNLLAGAGAGAPCPTVNVALITPIGQQEGREGLTQLQTKGLLVPAGRQRGLITGSGRHALPHHLLSSFACTHSRAAGRREGGQRRERAASGAALPRQRRACDRGVTERASGARALLIVCVHLRAVGRRPGSGGTTGRQNGNAGRLGLAAAGRGRRSSSGRAKQGAGGAPSSLFPSPSAPRLKPRSTWPCDTRLLHTTAATTHPRPNHTLLDGLPPSLRRPGHERQEERQPAGPRRPTLAARRGAAPPGAGAASRRRPGCCHAASATPAAANQRTARRRRL